MSETKVPQSKRREIADSLGTLGASVHRVFIRALNRALAGEGLTHVQFLALHQIHTHGAMSQSELAEILAIEGQTLVRMLDALQVDGWVRRAPDARDRRINRVELAAKPERLNRVLNVFRQLQVAALADFTEQELDTFLGLQQKLSGGLSRHLRNLEGQG